MPKISVIMPVYNVEKFVARSIESVLRQTHADFELILVDDGGNDQSLAICRNFKDPRIRIISQVNRGLAGAALIASTRKDQTPANLPATSASISAHMDTYAGAHENSATHS